MERIRLRILMFGTMSAAAWAAAAQAQEPMPPGPMPLPRIVTPDDSPPAAAKPPQTPANPTVTMNSPPAGTNGSPAPAVAAPPVIEPRPLQPSSNLLSRRFLIPGAADYLSLPRHRYRSIIVHAGD